jgi:hypothetical protein
LIFGGGHCELSQRMLAEPVRSNRCGGYAQKQFRRRIRLGSAGSVWVKLTELIWDYVFSRTGQASRETVTGRVQHIRDSVRRGICYFALRLHTSLDRIEANNTRSKSVCPRICFIERNPVFIEIPAALVENRAHLRLECRSCGCSKRETVSLLRLAPQSGGRHLR